MCSEAKRLKETQTSKWVEIPQLSGLTSLYPVWIERISSSDELIPYRLVIWKAKNSFFLSRDPKAK